MKKLLGLLLLFFLVFSCQKSTSKDKELEELFFLMQGSFNSEVQSRQDSSYYNISLHMYPIWKDKGNYLYVEQALNSMQNRPYRQRVYKVSRVDEETFHSEIFTLKNDSIWIGKWKTPEDFNAISFDDLSEREGCAVLLKKIGEHHFKGATANYTCESSLRGASYATSEVEIVKDKIISWDRGFDAEGNHVWGAIKGGYIFDKVDN